MPISVSDLVAPSGAQDITATQAPAAAAPAAAAPNGAQTIPPKPGFLQEPLTPKDESKAVIPDPVLQIPAFRALLQGSPPAVLITLDEFQSDPSLAVIQQNIEPLLYSGFGVYQPKSGNAAVFYNGQKIDGNAIKVADEKGQLDKVAVPYPELKSFFDANLGEASAEGSAAPAAPVASSPAMGAPAPASSQTKLATARVNNLAPGAPSSGPTPGLGRVLNNITKPTI